MSSNPARRRTRVPIWITVLQVLLILIMLTQAYLYYLDHDALRATGISIETPAEQRLVYEFAGRTLAMALASLFVVFWQRLEGFIVIFVLNLLREGQETLIDPLFPGVDPMTPSMEASGFAQAMDLGMHLVIVAVQAFVLYRLIVLWRASRADALAAEPDAVPAQA